MTARPRARLIYAVPAQHLAQDNGTTHRLRSLRESLARRFDVAETNLLDPPLRKQERLAMALAGLLGLSNNLRYLALSHRLPAHTDSELTLLVGNYCACLALFTKQGPVMLDMVDSLTLTDVRGIQSAWRWRPLLYLAQLPSSWFLEQRLKNHTHIQAMLITTEREKQWLERLHGAWTKLHVAPNQVKPCIDWSLSPPLPNNETVLLAFIGSMSWWINQISARKALQILYRFLRGPGSNLTVVLNFYGTASHASHCLPSSRHQQLKVVNHGYVKSLKSLAEHNHAAFLPNPIGRGFQNKLMSCVALGMPTIAHSSMSPHRIDRMEPGPVMYCKSQADYDGALLRLLRLNPEERKAISAASEAYIERFFSSKAINHSLEEIFG